MPFPLVLSVPHSGRKIPKEVEEICILSEEDILRDGDEGADHIYFPLETEVETMVTTDIARAVVDMNRGEDDRRKDGIIKTHTCWDVPVYRSQPSEDIITALIEKYYRPYHKRLSSLTGNAKVGLDCHTMAELGPPVGPDAGKKRPRVCLSDGDGTCPEKWLKSLAECFEKIYDTDTLINRPFTGGYIIRSHAKEIPWIQVELSREKFLSYEEKSRRVLEALRLWIRTID